MLTLDAVSASYGAVQALRDVSLDVQQGEIVARLTALKHPAPVTNTTPAPALAGTMTFAPEWLLAGGVLFIGMVLARRFGFGAKQ